MLAFLTWQYAAIAATLLTFILAIKRRKKTVSEESQDQAELTTYLSKTLKGHEIGRLYELYIGYRFELAGYEVIYNGAVKGYDDLGRDLIVKSADETLIVQTKNWAKHKKIPVKHIFQLAGSAEYFRREKRSKNIRAVFYTTASYSNEAVKAARLLDVELNIEKYDRDFPMIKCHVSESDAAKTYHFPYDKTYDSIKIVPRKGDLFVKTVHEAVSRGFRRARSESRNRQIKRVD